MAKHQVMLCVSLHLLLAMEFLLSTTSATTDSSDILALNFLYSRLNEPNRLTGWRLYGGDPCGDDWRGVNCSGTSVESIDISGYDFRAHLRFPPRGFNSLKYLDASFNRLSGEIPSNIPRNITHLDLSNNQLRGNIPLALGRLKYLSHLNLSHNNLSGPVGEVFASSNRLQRIDLTYNDFTDAPGTIPNLCAKQNMFLLESCVPSSLPSPRTFLTSTKGPTSGEEKAHNKKENLIVTACVIGLVVLIAVLSLILIIFKICIRKRPQLNESKSKKVPSIMQEQLPVTNSPLVTSLISSNHDDSIPDLRVVTVEPTGDCFSRACNKKYEFQRMPIRYSLRDVKVATRNFNDDNLIVQYRISYVYVGTFQNDEMTVNKMELVDILEEQLFLKVVRDMCHLKHPNIAGLVGYCLEQGECLLVYEYAGRMSVEGALHSSSLSWHARLSIALGVARALEYLHFKCSPPVAHGSIMAANILLDKELMPHILDCVLYSKSKVCQLRAHCKECNAPEYDMPRVDETIMPRVDETISDIYGFGLLMLELLTGRKPCELRQPAESAVPQVQNPELVPPWSFDEIAQPSKQESFSLSYDDSSRVKEQESLVKWASTQPKSDVIHSLKKMVDQKPEKPISSEELSQFAGVIAQCIQREPQLRPPINMIAEEVELLVRRQAALQHSMSLRGWMQRNSTKEGRTINY